MTADSRGCPDCDSGSNGIHRRTFLKAAGTATVVAGATPLWGAPEKPASQPESVVSLLYESLSPGQREKICFAWDYQDPKRGLLRTRISNNWNITEPTITDGFFTRDQISMIRSIFEGITQPDWHARFDKQLEDDCGGFGQDQSIAIFGKPGGGKFQFVLTGRHMTLRCDGNSAEHVAFGGPIFYGHAAESFDEEPHHPGNVFWHQALAANQVYEMLDGKQRELALIKRLPSENAVGFRGTAGGFPGIPLTECGPDQRAKVQEVLELLIEPYRQTDRDEVATCLNARGGLDKCSLAFYSDGDLGGDKVWDCWRLEGPAFVWYFRGTPHVHVWVNVADSPAVKLNA